MRPLLGLLALLAAAPAPLPAQAQPAPISRLYLVTVFVRDYDQAIAWYRDTLGFSVVEDQAYGPGRRWVTIAPPGQRDMRIVLSRAGEMDDPRGRAALIGKQALWVFATDDCRAAYEQLRARGVRFREPPSDLPHGVQAIFEDLYGNEFVLVQQRRRG